MGIDQNERQRQRKVDSPRQGKTHPYVAIEHRILDSASFQTLSHTGKAALLVVVRQLTRDNNGALQMTAKYFARFGFAENTVHRTTAELIEHGLIFRSRLGGFQRGPALFAVTWLPITRRDGLYLNDFKPNAWRDFEPPEKNSRPQNLRSASLKICGRSGSTASKFAVEPPPPFEDYVSVTNIRDVAAPAAPPPTRASARIFRLPLVADGRLHPLELYA